MRRASVLGLALAALAAAVAVALVLAVGGPSRSPDDPPTPRVAEDRPAPHGSTSVRRHVQRSPSAFCEVQREDGTPAVGATVVVRRPAGPADVLVTGEDGRVAWEPSGAGTKVLAVRPGDSCSRELDVAGEERIVLRLGPGATVRGAVRWADDTPVADAIVDMSLWRKGYSRLWTTRTGADGSYAFRGVPPGARVQPQVRHVEDVVPVGDVVRAEAPGWGETREIDLRARRPGSAIVHLDVELPDGVRPPDGFTVRAGEGPGVELIPASMSYDAEARRITGTVRAGVPTVLRVSAGVVHGGPLQGEAGPFTAQDGEELVLRVRVHGESALVLRATTWDGMACDTEHLVAHLLLARDGDVEPLGGCALGGQAPQDPTRLLPTLAALRTPGTRFHVVLDGPGIARGGLETERGANLTLEGFDLARRLEAGGRVELTVPLHRPIRATIQTLDAGGLVVPGVEVELSPPLAFSPTHVTTGEDGCAEVDVLIEPSSDLRDRLVARAAAPYRASARLPTPDSLDAAPAWSLVVRRLRTYRVRVVDESGAPVAGGRVATNGLDHWDVDEHGIAEISVLPTEQVLYAGETLESDLVAAPEGGDEIVLVAAPVAEVVVDLDATGVAPPAETVRVVVDRTGGRSVSTHSLLRSTERLHVALRGARGEEAVVKVTTVDGRYAGSARTTVGAAPVTITLAPVD